MMRAFFLVLIFGIQLFAGVVTTATYDITFGVFGKIGAAKATYERNATNYFISLEANSDGMAKFLSSNRKERYTSQGVVRDGILVPEVFTKFVFNDNKGDYSDFYFRHEDKNVTRHRTKYRLDDEGQKTDIKKSVKSARFYARDDLLTLFFNLPPWLKGMEEGDRFMMYSLGANKNDGRVDVYLPKGKDYQEIVKTLELDSKKLGVGEILVVAINQNIFASKNGELLIQLDADHLCQKAVLKDVIFFGDIVGTMTKKKVQDGTVTHKDFHE